MKATTKRLTALAVERASYRTLTAEGKERSGPDRIPDEDGLYLAIQPSNAKSWRYDFRFNGPKDRKVIVYGSYPVVTLEAARNLHIDAKRLISRGILPAMLDGKIVASTEKQKAERSTGDDRFRTVGEEWYEAEKNASPKSDAWKDNYRRWLDWAYEDLGNRSLPEIEAADVLDLVKKIEAKGHAASAEYLRGTISRVFAYGIRNLRAPKGFNPAEAIRGAVIVPDKVHHPKLGADELPAFIATVKNSNEDEAIKLGVMILLHTFPRRAELVFTPWKEINGDSWTIPADRMKKGRDHVIPLSTQVQEMFSRLRELSKGSEYVFPSPHDPKKSRCRQTFNHALWRLGYKGTFSPHGVRATAASILADHGYAPEVIDAQLAHAEEDETRAAYIRGRYLPQRKELMQKWSDLLDGYAAGGAQIIPMNAKVAEAA